MLETWKDLYSSLMVMKWLMVDPWRDLSWTFFVTKRLKLNPWKAISSTLTRELDLVIIVNFNHPPLLDFYSLFISRCLGLGRQLILLPLPRVTWNGIHFPSIRLSLFYLGHLAQPLMTGGLTAPLLTQELQILRTTAPGSQSKRRSQTKAIVDCSSG